MLDISYVYTPIFVPPRGFEGHLFLGLVPSIECAVLRQDAATRAGGHLYPLLEKRSMHAPFPNERVLLLFANLIGDVKCNLSGCFAGVRLVIQSLNPFLHPAFQGCMYTPSVCSPTNTRQWKQQTTLPHGVAQCCGDAVPDQGWRSREESDASGWKEAGQKPTRS